MNDMLTVIRILMVNEVEFKFNVNLAKYHQISGDGWDIILLEDGRLELYDGEEVYYGRPGHIVSLINDIIKK